MEININSQPNKKMKKIKEEEEDRLSDLPDSLLLHILSFLPLESALTMSTLARRWRALELDARAHALDLDFNFYYSDENLCKYIDFVNQSMDLHEGSHIRRFRCTFLFKRMNGSTINSWIDFSIKKKVQELDLCLMQDCNLNGYKLPYSFYEHRSLTSLKMDGFQYLELPRLKSFSFLRNLSLRNTKLKDGPFHELLVACPLLENLSLGGCFGLSLLRIPYSCLRLHHLSVRCCSFNGGLEIHAVNILSLKFHDSIDSPYNRLKISLSPKEVSLRLQLNSCLRERWSLGCHDNILFRIFKELADTEVLSLGSSCVQLASILELRNFSTYFHKLKHLKIETGFGTWKQCGMWQLHGIASLLRRSPRLQTLTIDMCCPGPRYGQEIFKSGHSSNEKKYWEKQESYFPCLVHHLKTINIYSDISYRLKNGKPHKYVLKTWESEMEVMKFFLKNAMVLEKMIIQLPMAIILQDKAAEVLLGIRQELEQLPKASSHAQLLFL